MTTRFESRKQGILEQLGAADGQYHDLSPKGSVDEPIRELIGEINTLDGLVTTSSCSGRISVFLEGRKAGSNAPADEDNGGSRAGPGGKGGGGAWLFLSHAPLDDLDLASSQTYMSLFGLHNAAHADQKRPNPQSRYIHLKFEPMILHILTASTAHAQRVLTAALAAGLRESGAVSLSTTKTGESTPMVAVRSTGYSFDSIIGYQGENDSSISMVDENYLQTMVAIANDRFKINNERIARFRAALINPSQLSTSSASNPVWEDADARKRRKREEGLARQRALQVDDSQGKSNPQSSAVGDGDVNGLFD